MVREPTRREFLQRSSLAGGVGSGLVEAETGAGNRDRTEAARRSNLQTGAAADVTVGPGGTESFDIEMDVSEGSPVDAVDVVFSFDLTQSMSEEVDTMKRRATQIMDEIAASSFDAAFGVTGFMDYPGDFESYGYAATYGESDDYPWRVHEAVTTDIEAVSDEINSLSLGSGQDGPESYTRALYEFAHGEIGWRDDALRVVVLFGDSIPHDDDFHETASEWGSYPDSSTGGDPGRDGELFTGDDLDFQSVVESLEIPIIGVNSGDADAWWRYVADRTGGAYYSLEDASAIPDTVVDLVGETSEEVTLTLRPEVGYADWFDWSPEQYDAVGAGETRSFDVTVSPPKDASVGTRRVSLHGIADGSRVQTFRVTVNVYGDTSRPIPVSNLSGGGRHLDSRLSKYEWYRKSLQSDYWLDEGVRKLEYFRSDFQSGLTDLEGLARDTAAEAVGAGYYSEAALAAKEAVTLSGTLKAWGIGNIENRARSNIPGYRIERAGISDPAATIGEVQRLLRATTDASEDGNRGPALEKLDSLLAYLEAWRTEVRKIEIESEYRAKMDHDEKDLTLDATAGASGTLEFTAGVNTQTVSWDVRENGWLPRWGEYRVTVEVVGKGRETVTTRNNGGTIRMLGSPSFATPDEGDRVRFTIEVVEPPETVVPDWLSEVTEIDVTAEVNYNYRTVESDEEDSTFRNLVEEHRRANRTNAIKHLTSAINFFKGERELLRPDEMVAASAASPVDLHVTGEGGALGARYLADGTVSAVERSLRSDYLYTGPGAHPEGVVLCDASGDYEMEVLGRDTGSYDFEVVRGTVTEAGLETERVQQLQDVPTRRDDVDALSITVDSSGDGFEVDVDVVSISTPSDGTGPTPTRRPDVTPSDVSTAFQIPVGNVVIVGVGALVLYRFLDRRQEDD